MFSYFEYNEIIIVNNSEHSKTELFEILNPTSKDIMLLDFRRKTQTRSCYEGSYRFL